MAALARMVATAKSGMTRRALAPPVGNARDDNDRDDDRAEHHQVARRVRHRRHPDREPHGVAQPRVHDEAIGGEQRQRQPPRVDALQVRDARQGMGVEREHRSREQAGRAIARPLVHEDVSGVRRQREAEHQENVEHEHGGRAEPRERCSHERRDDERLGIRQRVPFRVEHVGVEEPRRRAGQLVRDPRDDELVELRVGVVVACERAGRGHERPRVDDSQQKTQTDRRPRIESQPHEWRNAISLNLEPGSSEPKPALRAGSWKLVAGSWKLEAGS